MSAIDMNSVAGFKAVDAEGNELGIMSMADITAAVKESIMQDAAMARSVATLSEASTLAASDTYEDELDIKTDLTWARGLDANGNPILISKQSLASVVGGLLKNEAFALSLSALSGYNCQFMTLNKGIEQQLPISVSGVISIGYSPYSYNKIVKVSSANLSVETIADSWWGDELSVRVDDEGKIFLKQTQWNSQKLRIVSL